MNLLSRTTLTLCLALLTACGGGGGGGGNSGGSGEEPKDNTITVSWQAPITRGNGSTLLQSEIQGYTIIYFEKEELDSFISTYSSSELSADDFIQTPDIGQHLSRYEIAKLIEEGSPNLAQIPNGEETSHTLPNLTTGTYYMAISTYDFENIFSDLSNTIEISL